KKKYEPAFKRMREDMRFARGLQYPGQTSIDDDRASVDIIQRHINARVASLYAKNPTFAAKRRKRMDFALWDGDGATLQRTAQTIAEAMAAGAMPDPNTVALMTDIQEGITRRRMLDRIGRTLEIVMAYSLDEQQPSFKARCKRLVRRTVTCGVGYLKVGYQRALQARPDAAAELGDITTRIATQERLSADLADGISDDQSADAEALRVTQEGLAAEQDVLVREGLVFDFPAATRIIPDVNTTELVGWVGSQWVTEELLMSAEEIKEVYSVDVGDKFTGYRASVTGDATVRTAHNAKDRKALVWVMHHKKHGVVYHMVDGYPDFLRDPAPPPVQIEQFFPFFPLLFNDMEAEDELFPRSDVRLLRSPQREMNRKREAVRQHRIAARPRYLGQKGKFEDGELTDISTLADHEVLFVNALEAGEKLENVIQKLPAANIDPNLYETGSDMNDVQLIVGASESQLGNPGGKTTATGDAIAEQSRLASVTSNADDLDDLLSAVAGAAGDILLSEMDRDTVLKIAGPGGVWPELDRQSIAEDLFLEIEAGSSGRPNKAQDIANFERMAPTLMQIPGISPEWLAQHAIKILDASIDFEDAITAGLPSIVQQNSAPQPSTGDPATDPAQQGGEGGNNAPNNDTSAGGGQPAMPADGGQAAPESAPV
ncbi:MAG TPA: hypothetical protein VGB85_27050, partial [Nannocystis sp.]